MGTSAVIKFRNGFYGFLCLGIAINAILHLFHSGFYEFKGEEISSKLIFQIAFHMHFLGGAVALGVGWTQFLKKFRAKRLSLHRRFGYIYVISIVLISSPAAFFMAMQANGGFNNVVGFGMMAICWFGFTLMAFNSIKNKDVNAHERWMIRSFAVTLGAVTLRLFLPIMAISGVPFSEAYQTISWFCWVPNLFVAEYIIQSKLLSTTP
jgi:uncharacterized membrane protein